MPFQNLRPLPMRITEKQYERLRAARENDHTSIQEHVRRALDNYLDLLDRKAARNPPKPPPETKTLAIAEADADNHQTRLVYR